MTELFTQLAIPLRTWDETIAMGATEGNPQGADQASGGLYIGGRYVGGTLEGASYLSSLTGARFEILPESDLTIGCVAYDAAGTEVFKVLVTGTDKGDVIIGNYAGGQGAKWDDFAATFSVKGTFTASEIHIPDTVTANSFHADSSGNTWWGSILIGDAVAKVLKTGAATFTSISITGGVIDGTTTIDGRIASVLAGAIDASGHFADDAISTAAGTILGEFIFTGSGALQIGTYVNGVTGDIRISPTGLLGRDNAGATTFSINATTGVAVLNGLVVGTNVGIGTAVASADMTTIVGGIVTTSYINAKAITVLGAVTSGSFAIGSNAWHLDSSGNMWWGNYASYALALIKISAAGSIDFTTGTFSGALSAATGTLGIINSGEIYSGIFSTAASGATGKRITLSSSGNSLTMYDSDNANIVNFNSHASIAVTIVPAKDFAGLLVQNQGATTNTNRMLEVDKLGAGSSNDTCYFANEGSGVVVSAYAVGTGKGIIIDKSGTAATALEINSSTANDAIEINQSGAGYCLDLNKTNVGAGDVININNAGTGYSIHLLQSKSTNSVNAMFVDNEGSGRTFEWQQNAVANNNSMIYIDNKGTGYDFESSNGAYLSNDGHWTDTSRRALKENFKEIKNVLDKINQLDIKEYTHIKSRKKTVAEMNEIEADTIKKIDNDSNLLPKEKEEEKIKWRKVMDKNRLDESKRIIQKHYSPMAEDFNMIFGLGDDKSIAPIDVAGVALQAIKELNQRVEQLETKIKKL